MGIQRAVTLLKNVFAQSIQGLHFCALPLQLKYDSGAAPWKTLIKQSHPNQGEQHIISIQKNW